MGGILQMKLSEQETPLKGHLLPFPMRKIHKREVDLSHILAFPLEERGEVLISVEDDIEKKNKTRAVLEERVLQDSQLPPFVIKMRKISALSNKIKHIRRTSNEISYYLQEIKNHSAPKS